MAKKVKQSKLEWFKKNIVIVPVIAAILAGTFTSIRYVLSLTDTIEATKSTLTEMHRDIKDLKDKVTGIQTRLSAAEATWEMAENLYRQLADQVREHSYDIKDLNRLCFFCVVFYNSASTKRIFTKRHKHLCSRQL